MAYHCPYCDCRDRPVTKRRRTLLGNIAFIVVALFGVIVLLALAGTVAATGNYYAVLFLFVPAALLVVSGLILSDHIFRENVQVCPECRLKVG